MSQTKKTVQQTAQTVAKQVGQQSNEVLKETARQVAPAVFGSPNMETVQKVSEGGYDKAQFDTDSQAKLQALRNKLRQIQQEEEIRARQNVGEQNKNWQEQQKELMDNKKEQHEEGIVTPQGKQKRGFLGRFRKQNTGKAEMGRGDKN